MEEQGRLLDDGNRHRETGSPLVNIEGIELTGDLFWKGVRFVTMPSPFSI